MMMALLQAAKARRQEGLVHTVVPGVQQIQDETLSPLYLRSRITYTYIYMCM